MKKVRGRYRSVHWTVYLKRGCLVCTGVSLLFLMYQFYVWDMWSASYYQQQQTCNEEVYNIPTKSSPFLGDAVFGDIELRNSCSKKESLWKEEFVKRGLFTDELYDKCGNKLQPKLISLRTTARKEEPGAFVVPNVVHYTSLGRWKFSFLNYLSFKSVQMNINPANIFIHGDDLPFGEWFERTLTDVPNIYYVKRQRPIRIQGRKVMWLEHSSDVIRLQTLLDNGGIYLDTDVLALRSFDTLRKYPATLGRETEYGLGSGIIVAQPRSTFVCIWFQSYRNYNPFPWHWASYAVWTPNKLAKEIPQDIHIEERNLQHPSWTESELLFNELYDWEGKNAKKLSIDSDKETIGNYAIHIWKRYGNVPTDPEQIKRLNTTLGEVMRYIYFGSKDLLLDSKGVDVSGEFGTRWSFPTFVDLVGTRILDFFHFNT